MVAESVNSPADWLSHLLADSDRIITDDPFADYLPADEDEQVVPVNSSGVPTYVYEIYDSDDDQPEVIPKKVILHHLMVLRNGKRVWKAIPTTYP